MIEIFAKVHRSIAISDFPFPFTIIAKYEAKKRRHFVLIDGFNTQVSVFCSKAWKSYILYTVCRIKGKEKYLLPVA